MKSQAAALPGMHTRSSDFFALTKPRLNFLVVATALAGYYMGAPVDGSLATLVHTVMGTALVAARSAALNMLFERRVDGLMVRTRRRPLPDGRLPFLSGPGITIGRPGYPAGTLQHYSVPAGDVAALPDGRLQPREALWFALGLSAVGLVQLALGANLLAALVAFVTLVTYIAWLPKAVVESGYNELCRAASRGTTASRWERDITMHRRLSLFDHLCKATFLARPIRFVVECLLRGRKTPAYLPNPGRLRELLLPGATLYLTDRDHNAEKRMPCTAVAVEREGIPVLLHTHLTNSVARWLIDRGMIPGIEGYRVVKSEVGYGSSRFDFLLHKGSEEFVLEVKSCTLFGKRIAMFPDAVTERGTRHLRELSALRRKGLKSGVLFRLANTPMLRALWV